MIIKSMARKAPSFAQLIAYISRDADASTGAAFARNLYHSGLDETVVAGQFLENWRHLPARANGNALYHEVIVLERQPHLDRASLNAALLDIAGRYCALRGAGQLAWGRVHHDTDYPHIHLMLSSNAVLSRRRARLSKSSFAALQRDLERYAAKAHPELTVTPIYDRSAAKETPRITKAEGERKRRTGAPSRKEEIFAALTPIFEAASDRAALEEALTDAGFRLYQRGRTFGVEDRAEGKRYRLKTLGLEASFERIGTRSVARAEPSPGALHREPERVGSEERGDGGKSEELDTGRNASARREGRGQLEDARAVTIPSAVRPPKGVRPAGKATAPADLAATHPPAPNTGPRSENPTRPVDDQTAGDDRAAALLAERAAMEEAAQERLDGFDREGGGGREQGSGCDARDERDDEEKDR